MIRPFSEAVFTTVAEGDLRGDCEARKRLSDKLGIPRLWGELRQVHGNDVLWVTEPGIHGHADAIATTTPGLPIAVFTADCVPVILQGEGAVGVAHAGWRGMAAGVISQLAEGMIARGFPPQRAVIGPSIGPCCFEVGEEVSRAFQEHRDQTNWGTPSVDLWAAALDEVDHEQALVTGRCTRCDNEFFSHRRDGTSSRMAAVTWLK